MLSFPLILSQTTCFYISLIASLTLFTPIISISLLLFIFFIHTQMCIRDRLLVKYINNDEVNHIFQRLIYLIKCLSKYNWYHCIYDYLTNLPCALVLCMSCLLYTSYLSGVLSLICYRLPRRLVYNIIRYTHCQQLFSKSFKKIQFFSIIDF